MVKSVLNGLYEVHYWLETLSFFEFRAYRQKEKLSVYKTIVENKQYLQMADQVLAGNYIFGHPLKLVVNKFQTGKKKIVYLFESHDDFLLKVINRILTNRFSSIISPACHSFQKQKGAKTAFRSLLNDFDIDKKACLKTDVRNFFNSINPIDFIEHLPDCIKNDKILLELIKQLLLNNKARIADGRFVDEPKGLMAGCPLSPFLSNIYLRDLDAWFIGNQINYMRYSDDIVIFDYEENINAHFEFIEKYLAHKKLKINKAKTSITQAGKIAVFLGFSYYHGVVDLSPVSVQKMKSKIRRLSRAFHRRIERRKMEPHEALMKFIVRINRKLYGVDAIENELCWAHWFFPVINCHHSLEILDKYIQNRLRYTLTGKYSTSNYRKVPYQIIKRSGYIPLKSSYFAFKTNYEQYLEMINKNLPT